MLTDKEFERFKNNKQYARILTVIEIVCLVILVIGCILIG